MVYAKGSKENTWRNQYETLRELNLERNNEEERLRRLNMEFIIELLGNCPYYCSLPSFIKLAVFMKSPSQNQLAQVKNGYYMQLLKQKRN